MFFTDMTKCDHITSHHTEYGVHPAQRLLLSYLAAVRPVLGGRVVAFLTNVAR